MNTIEQWSVIGSSDATTHVVLADTADVGVSGSLNFYNGSVLIASLAAGTWAGVVRVGSTADDDMSRWEPTWLT